MYFFRGLGRRVPLAEVVLEIQSVIKIICSRRDLTGCFVEKNKPILPLKAKANKNNI